MQLEGATELGALKVKGKRDSDPALDSTIVPDGQTQLPKPIGLEYVIGRLSDAGPLIKLISYLVSRCFAFTFKQLTKYKY